MDSPISTNPAADTATTDPACLHQLIEAQAQARPDHAAVRDEQTTLTYAELNERANRVAHLLLDAGVTPGAAIGLCLDRSVELVAGLLGILKAGCAYVPLDPHYPTERLAHILDQASPVCVLSRQALAARLPDNAPRVLDLGDSAAHDATNPDLETDPDSLCYVIFTSGSTGQPKGVMVSHANVTRLFTCLKQDIGFSATDRWSMFHSFAFGFSAWELFGALLHGSELIIIPAAARGDPDELCRVLDSTGVTVLSQTPSAFRQLLASPTFQPDKLALRLVTLSGEAVADADLDSWFGRVDDNAVQLFNTYAITETGGQVALRTYQDAASSLNSAGNIGQPLTDTPVWIVDADLQPLPDGAVGELLVGGPGVASGYIGEPELTARSFITATLDGSAQRVYRTGDRARRCPDGSIEFAGRADNQVKVRGYRVELGDIESCLTRHADVREAAVVLRHDSSGDSRLTAYLVAPAEPPTVTQLRDHVSGSLPDYMVPAQFVFLDQLPLNQNGKLDRNALPEPGHQRPELKVEYAPPETPLEHTVSELWAAALGLDKVGIDDNFFELGGDSILALKLTTSLRRALDVYVYIAMLLDAPTVRQLAAVLAAAPAESAAADNLATRLPTVVPHSAERHEPFPLTDIQQAYLVGRGTDFAMGNVSTHLYIEVDAPALDLPRLEAAWQQVIDRHPMLRAIVHPDGTQQILADVPAYQIATRNLRSASPEAIAAGLTQERERLSHQVIPSDRWPLFELTATLLPEDTTRLHISLDCLITDARSFQIVSAELLAFYEDPQARLPLPNLTFRDYVLAERELRESSLFARALDYWRERITTLPAMPQLPLAKAPETLTEQHFEQRGYELSRPDWERLQARAARAGITPTVALLQCFGEALAAWSRSPELTLNLTLFNRLPLHPDVDDVVGDFTSLVLLGISDLTGGTFETRSQRLQRELWQGVDHRFVSGVRVMRELAQRGDKVQPMMPIVFTSTLGIGSGGQDSMSWHRLGKQVFSVSQTPQVWIDHVASERDGALWCTWDVVEELFPAGMIDALFGAYTARLHALATDESAWQQDWATDLAAHLPAAQAERRIAANDTAAPEPDELLHAGFSRQAQAQPDAPAIITSELTLSYAELDRLSNSVARQLVERDVSTNELVAVVMQKGWEQVVAVLGILKAGAAYMPVDAAMPTERLHYLLEFGAVRTALTQRCHATALEWPHSIKKLVVGEAELADSSHEPVNTTPSLTDIAYVIFTSGSTGQPKGVVIDHRGAVNTCADINQRFAIGPQDRVLALSSLSFDLSVYDIFGLLAAGGAVVMPDAGGMRDPAHWATLIAQHRVTLWNTVPALMDLLTEYAEQQTEPVLDSLRVVMMSGDWIPVRLPDRIRALGTIDVYSLGGATEASIWSILYPIATVPDDWTSIPYGKPMLNQRFYVLSSDLTPCPDWVAGELYIGGIGVALGYWQDDERTAASFITHPRTGERLYRTGDLGRYLPDGNIEFLGREDFQVKIQGFRVELGDIEAALEAHPQVRNAVVIASGPARGAKRLIAYFVAEGATPAAAELTDWLAAKLPAYMQPGTFMQLERLPLTANGKVDRQALPEPALTAPQAGGGTPAAADGQDDIASAVAAVLDTDSIDRSANLLQLGATSIEMIRIANALDQQLGFRPRMDDFYREPSIAGLIALYAQHAPATVRSAAPGGDPLLTPDWLLAGIPARLDPDERDRFKASRPALRRFPAGTPTVELDQPRTPAATYSEQRSYRSFSSAPLARRALAQLLECLHAIPLNAKPKYLYASAGGLYPVQAYLYVKADRISDIPAGYYYYDTDQHALVTVGSATAPLRELYDPIVNRPLFDQAAFALFLVADIATIGSMYPDRALHYATLEAGHMTQLLELQALRAGLGLCQTGGLEQAALQPLLDLGEHSLLLHGLLGGTPAEHEPSALAPPADGPRDEGEI